MKRFKNILLFADPDTDVAVSAKWALTLAKQNHARLTVSDVAGLLPRDLQRAITIVTPLVCEVLNGECRIRTFPPLPKIISINK